MHRFEHIEPMRQWLQQQRCAGKRIALVPTMGNLHEGHLQLVDAARQQADVVIASIFVNPAQFGPNEDFERYPRTLEADCQQLQGRGCDAVFSPSVQEMYPDGWQFSTRLTVPQLANKLCGASRPGHFDGVCLVVARLFNLIQPDVAVFGEKDRQQLMIVQTMSRALGFPVDLLPVPTARADDGLALSSRNQYLSTQERKQAPELYRTLCWMAEQIRQGARNYRQLETEAVVKLQQAGFRPDYLQICQPNTLDALADGQPCEQGAILFSAAYLGQARLIDNLKVEAT